MYYNSSKIMALNAYILFKTDHIPNSRSICLKTVLSVINPTDAGTQAANPRLSRTLCFKMSLFFPGMTVIVESASRLLNPRKKWCNKCLASTDK